MRSCRRALTGCSVLAVLATAAGGAPILIDFEEGVGHDKEEINSFYEGMTFQSVTSGNPGVYVDANSNNWHATSWPGGQRWNAGYFWINDLAGAFTTLTGDDGRIGFDNADATFVQINYCAFTEFHLEAYDAAGGLLDSDAGPANLRFINGNESGPGTLRVEAPAGEQIAYALVHDSGNQWVIDNVLTDATGIRVIPEPLSVLLLAGGFAGLATRIRRRPA